MSRQLQPDAWVLLLTPDRVQFGLCHGLSRHLFCNSTPVIPRRIWLIFLWNFSEPDLIPKGNILKQKRLHGVMKVVSGLDSYASFICQNPEFASSFENTLEPANLPRVVSTAWSGWFSLLTYLFSLLRLTQTLTLPLLLGVTTVGAHQSVGWSTGYDTCLQHPFKLFFWFLIQWGGYFLWTWQLERFGIFFECDTVTVLHDS